MILGIDIGSMAISAVFLDLDGKVSGTFYEFHEGQIGKVLQDLSDKLEPGSKPGIALTSSSHLHLNGYDSIAIQTALIRASQLPEVNHDYILHVGAEKFYLIKRGPDKRYESSRTNTSCAAGTGSFLDQQSSRLQIPSIGEFCMMAKNNTGKVPEIASRVIY